MRTARQLVDHALAQVETLPVAAARALLGRDDVVFVDLRERGELAAEGRIPGAVHVPRGLLEFAVDPASEWHRRELAPGRRLVLFCAMGWRSALAAQALQQMGVEGVCHIGDGFSAWKAAGAPVDEPPAAKRAGG